jgi:hypothetical protein
MLQLSFLSSIHDGLYGLTLLKEALHCISCSYFALVSMA